MSEEVRETLSNHMFYLDSYARVPARWLHSDYDIDGITS